MVPMLKAYFEGKALRQISVQLVERFKTDRMNTPIKKGTARQPDIPMNDEVRETLAELCKDNRPIITFSLVLKTTTNVCGK